MSRQHSPNYLRGFAKLTVVVVLLAAAALVAIDRSDTRPGSAPPSYTEAELAYLADMALVLDVDRVDPDGSLAGGRNACWLIAEHGIDPVTLDGWEEHWHQPWEREMLQAAVAHLCPAGGVS